LNSPEVLSLLRDRTSPSSISLESQGTVIDSYHTADSPTEARRWTE